MYCQSEETFKALTACHYILQIHFVKYKYTMRKSIILLKWSLEEQWFYVVA